MKRYWVSIPVAYYEVYEVEASSEKTAIAKVKRHTDVDQVCTDANKGWSKKIRVEERPKKEKV